MNQFLKQQKDLMVKATRLLTSIEVAEEVIKEMETSPIAQSKQVEVYRKVYLAGLHLKYGDCVTKLMKNFCDEMGLEIAEKEFVKAALA